MLAAPLLFLIVGGVLGASFWAAYLVACRVVEHPAAVFFLTLLIGVVFLAIVITGVYAGCSAIFGNKIH
jgi:hypothetical protein